MHQIRTSSGKLANCHISCGVPSYLTYYQPAGPGLKQNPQCSLSVAPGAEPSPVLAPAWSHFSSQALCEWGGGWVTPPESKPILYPTLCYLPSSLPLTPPKPSLGLCGAAMCLGEGGGTPSRPRAENSKTLHTQRSMWVQAETSLDSLLLLEEDSWRKA